jgi:hypothetical protein
MQYDQRNRMNETRALCDLVYGSYRCFKKCNAIYAHPVCISAWLWMIEAEKQNPYICQSLFKKAVTGIDTQDP